MYAKTTKALYVPTRYLSRMAEWPGCHFHPACKSSQPCPIVWQNDDDALGDSIFKELPSKTSAILIS